MMIVRLPLLAISFVLNVVHAFVACCLGLVGPSAHGVAVAEDHAVNVTAGAHAANPPSQTGRVVHEDFRGVFVVCSEGGYNTPAFVDFEDLQHVLGVAGVAGVGLACVDV